MNTQNKAELKITTQADLLDKAINLHEERLLTEAQSLFEQVLETQPENDTALYRIGIIHLQTGRPGLAIPFLKKAADIDTQSPDILNNLGSAYFQTEDYNVAEEVYIKSLGIMPNHAYTLCNLALLMKHKGQFENAEIYLQRAICFKRDYAEAHNNLGLLYQEQGRLEEATAKFHEALRHNPNSASAYNNLGNTMRELGKREDAEKYFRKSIECDPNFADAYNNLGNVLRGLMKLDEAEQCFKKATELDPHHEMALYNLMMMYEFAHRLNEAKELLEQTKKMNPDHPAIALLTAKLARRNGNIEEGIKALEERPISNDRWGMYSYFELGQLYDRHQEPQNAFDAFTKANEIHSRSNEARYTDDKSFLRFISEGKKALTKDWTKSWTPTPPENKKYPTPVFIVGFPRSGTTLLDQILSSHPDFHVAEEKPAVEVLRGHLEQKYGNYTDCLAELSAEEIESLRKMFYEIHATYEPWDGKGYFVDKFPLNTVMAVIIYRIFPDAKFIFAQRHPCDCVLSCFMQQFNLNPAMIHFLDLKQASRFYSQVMDFWFQLQDTLPLNVYTHRYEGVIEDFKGNIAALLDFLEVPWNDSVLEYDKTAQKKAKTISTPSYSQVTEKIYTRARYRWEHYKDQMKPVLDILLPYAQKLGYGKTEK